MCSCLSHFPSYEGPRITQPPSSSPPASFSSSLPSSLPPLLLLTTSCIRVPFWVAMATPKAAWILVGVETSAHAQTLLQNGGPALPHLWKGCQTFPPPPASLRIPPCFQNELVTLPGHVVRIYQFSQGPAYIGPLLPSDHWSIQVSIVWATLPSLTIVPFNSFLSVLAQSFLLLHKILQLEISRSKTSLHALRSTQFGPAFPLCVRSSITICELWVLLKSCLNNISLGSGPQHIWRRDFSFPHSSIFPT